MTNSRVGYAVRARYLGVVLMGGLVASAFVACGDDGGSDDGGDAGDVAIVGVVRDAGGDPIEGVFATAYGASATTNADGRFEIAGVDLPPDRAVVSLERDGFFSLTVGAKPDPSGAAMTLTAVMLEREMVGEIDNDTGGTAATSELDLEFPAFAFVDATGAAAKNVRVFAAYIDPESESFGAQMPGGDFSAVDESGEEGVLTSFGAAIVEAESEDGEPLSLADEALTCLQIPPSLLDAAPPTIAVWEMRDGRWHEIGTADRIDDAYCFLNGTLGPVNCDLFSRSAVVAGRVCDEEGEPVAEAQVKIGQLITTTSAEGVYGAVIPADTAARIRAEQGDDVICEVQARESYEVDLGPCPDAKVGDVECTGGADVDPGRVFRDPVSGRDWQTPHASRSFFTLDEAEAYCAGLDLEGTGWEVPTLDDLRSLIRGCPDTEPEAPLCDLDDALVSACACSFEPAGPAGSGCYWPDGMDPEDCTRSQWSSTTVSDPTTGEALVWTVEFRRALLYPSSLTQSGVMCVR